MLEIIPPQTMRSDNILIPSDAIWYPLHGDMNPRNAAHPTLAFATGNTGDFNTQGYYNFPVPNTTDIMNSDNSVSLDAILSMVGMAAGNQWIFAWEQTVNTPSGTGFEWVYGGDGGSSSFFGLALLSTRFFQFQVRGKGASAVTYQWNNTIVAGGARVIVVMSIEAQSANIIRVRLMKQVVGVDASPVDLGYSDPLDVLGVGTANPGRSGFANHPGLTFGARPVSTWAPSVKSEIARYASFFGNGTGTARLGNFSARKYAAYDANRQSAIMADMGARPREFPRSML